jgi:hypothetical protein
MRNDQRVAARRPRYLAAISRLSLDIADHRSLWYLADRKDVADLRGRFRSAGDCLTDYDPFWSVQATSLSIGKLDKRQRRPATWVMHNINNCAIDASCSVYRCQRRIRSGCDSPIDMSSEYSAPSPPSLNTYSFTHPLFLKTTCTFLAASASLLQRTGSRVFRCQTSESK